MENPALAPTLEGSSSRLVVVGSGSFIGGAILAEARSTGFPALSVARPSDLAAADVRPSDLVVVCALNPALRSSAYDATNDVELQTANALRPTNCRFVMISTRRVYPSSVRWGAKETDVALGDGTHYGNNKAATEAAMKALLRERLTILRLSNVFGFEYNDAQTPRRSFFGLMMHRLKVHGEIYFDMAPATRRDFIAVEAVARAILSLARRPPPSGAVYNVGSGHPVACGALAQALIEGFGSGRLRAEGPVEDEFYLDLAAWTTAFGMLEGTADLLGQVRRLGERLRDA